jgi:hypothetical protein
MQNFFKSHRRLLLVGGALTYLILFIFAVLFYKERIFFSDAAFHLFEIVRSGGEFTIQHSRFVAYSTELFPYFFTKLGMPLESVVYSYSVSFIVLDFIAFFVLILGFKNQKLALAFLLFNILMARHSFYWCLSELIQGVAFFFLFLGVVLKMTDEKKSTWLDYLLIVIFLLVAVFAHPMMLFFAVFAFLYFGYKNIKNSSFLILSAVMFIVLYGFKFAFFRDEYDVYSSQKLSEGLKMFPHYFDTIGFKSFVHDMFFDYYLVLALYVGLLIFYFSTRRFFRFFLIFLYPLGFAFINIIAEPNGANQFYIETRYIVLSIFVILPFVYDVLPLLKRNTAIGLIASLVVISLVSIFDAHTIYTQRLVWLRSFVRQTETLKNNKLIVLKSKLPMDTVMMDWAMPYEVWLLSTVESGVTRSIVTIENEHQFENEKNCRNCFFNNWGPMDYSIFPKEYFKFTDTTTPYVYY